MSLADSVQKKINMYNQVFDFESAFNRLAEEAIYENDTTVLCRIDSVIDANFTDTFDSFDWDTCSRLREANVEDDDIVEYADELGIPIDNECYEDMLVLTDNMALPLRRREALFNR